MGKRRTLRPGRVRSLQRLVELLGIAEQHEVRGARRRGDRVRERHLAGLIDEQHVDAPDHVVSRPQPGGAADHVQRAVAEAVACRWVALEVDRLRVCEAVLARLLADRDLDAALVRDVGCLLEQFPDHLVAVRGNADTLSRRHEVDDHPRADRALSRSRRALDCEVALVEREHEAPRGILRGVVSSERRPVAAPRPRRTAHQQIAPGAVLARPVDTMLKDPPRQSLQALGLRRRADEVVGNEGSRSATRHGIVRLLSDADPVFLRWETEAIDRRFRLGSGVAPRALEGQLPESVGFLPALRIGELLPQIEVAPPERLPLPAMPVQELRQQPASALGVVPVSRIVRQPGGKRVDELVYRLLRLAVLASMVLPSPVSSAMNRLTRGSRSALRSGSIW